MVLLQQCDTFVDPSLAYFCAIHFHTLIEAYRAMSDGQLVSPYTLMMSALLEEGFFLLFLPVPMLTGNFSISRRVVSRDKACL